MKPMIYRQIDHRELLDRGTYKNHEYFVISFGTHPCAYVKLNGESSSMAEGIPCHGGVTYNEGYLKLPDERLEGEFIGWDYAHYGDRYGDTFDGWEHTTEEMISECRRFIDELTTD